MERKSGKIQCKYQKNDPTFFGTSNFETWLSRDPITWHPEVRCFGYRMTHFIILPPQKFFSSTLQILGFIAESGHYYNIKLLGRFDFKVTGPGLENCSINGQKWTNLFYIPLHIYDDINQFENIFWNLFLIFATCIIHFDHFGR